MQEQENEGIVDKRAASRMNESESAPAEAAATPAEPAAGSPEAQLAEALEKAESNLRNWQRTAADFQNYKRLVEQQRGEMARVASVSLLINLLPVYDDLDRAVASVDASLASNNWAQGVIGIHRKFAQLIEAMGLKEVAAPGDDFDPNRHEAVARQPGEEGKILHVVQKGYALESNIIRPALVIVGDGTAANS